MLNKVILIGRITKDVELRRTNNGTAVVSFTLAVDNRFVLKDGKSTTDFISWVSWSNKDEKMEKYVRKGMLLAIEGRIQTRNYDSKEGNKVYVTEVVCENMRMLESKGGYEEKNAPSNLEEYAPTYNKKTEIENEEQDEEYNISDDDLPF